MNPIPKETAVELCRQICIEEVGQWYSWFSSPCWECVSISGFHPQKLGVTDLPGYRGCARVNTLYETYQKLN